MKYYLDTNIWVAAFIPKHPQNKSSKQLIQDCLEQNIEMVTSGHCLLFGRGLFGAYQTTCRASASS